MSKAWGGIGSWAEDAEREESEEREVAPAPHPVELQSFPSLTEAVRTKPKTKKMTLNEFHSTESSGLGGGGRRVESKGLTPDEMLRLPTGPKERSADEMQYGRLGGGLSYYNRTGPPRMRDRDDDNAPSWGGGGGRRQYGGYDDERRGGLPPRASDYDQPSRADEVDNWAMAKKSLASFDSGRQSRYGSLGGGIGGGSRADEVDNWAIGKKPLPSRSPSFGSGFGDSKPDPDRWIRGEIREPERERRKLNLDPPRGDAGGNESIRTNRPSPFGAARPREEVLAEKGLDWKKREMEIEAKKSSGHSSLPTSAQSSRPSSAQSARSEGLGLQQGLENVAVKPRPKVNPFGDAKPREVQLQKRGQDWPKIDLDLEHQAVDRPETEEEKLLKEQIETLKKEFTKSNSESLQGSVEDQHSVQNIISLKERELEMLTRDLDDKVRFGQKAVERPGSGGSRTPSFPERPPSQSGSIDDSRSVEFMDRPRSRGIQDTWTSPGDQRPRSRGMQDNWTRPGDERPRSRGMQDDWTMPGDERRAFQGGRERGSHGMQDNWTRPGDERPGSRGMQDDWTMPGDERRAFQGGRERGYVGSRNFDRPRARERW